MSTITDLDILLPEPKKVRLGERVYLLSADIPMPLMLRLEQFAGRELDNELVTELYQQVLGLFRVHQPELEDLPISLTQLVQFVGVVYGGQEVEPRPTKPKPARGTTNGSARKPTKNRSRS